MNHGEARILRWDSRRTIQSNNTRTGSGPEAVLLHSRPFRQSRLTWSTRIRTIEQHLQRKKSAPMRCLVRSGFYSGTHPMKWPRRTLESLSGSRGVTSGSLAPPCPERYQISGATWSVGTGAGSRGHRRCTVARRTAAESRDWRRNQGHKVWEGIISACQGSRHDVLGNLMER